MRGELRPTSKLAEAIGYALNRPEALQRFFEDGRIELDTGHLERSLRGPVLGRRNYLFFGSLQGGRTAAVLYSVVQSARLHHLDVTAYLTDVLRRLPALLPTDAAAIGELLPDRWAKAHPEHVLIAAPRRVPPGSRTAPPATGRPPLAHPSMIEDSPTVPPKRQSSGCEQSQRGKGSLGRPGKTPYSAT